MSRPPITGPSTGASSIGTPTTLITRPMWRGPAACASVIIPTGMIMPPASPWSTRKAISEFALQARPQSALVITKPADDGHPDALGAEALGRPAGQRDHGREREQVAGRDPLDRGERRVQVLRERLERDVHDRRVEDRHDRTDHDDDRDRADLRRQAVRVAHRRASTGGWALARAVGARDDRRLVERLELVGVERRLDRARLAPRDERGGAERDDRADAAHQERAGVAALAGQSGRRRRRGQDRRGDLAADRAADRADDRVDAARDTGHLLRDRVDDEVRHRGEREADPEAERRAAEQDLPRLGVQRGEA